jgi:hypothetical protein
MGFRDGQGGFTDSFEGKPTRAQPSPTILITNPFLPKMSFGKRKIIFTNLFKGENRLNRWISRLSAIPTQIFWG